jgi:hypothetical protein
VLRSCGCPRKFSPAAIDKTLPERAASADYGEDGLWVPHLWASHGGKRDPSKRWEVAHLFSCLAHALAASLLHTARATHFPLTKPGYGGIFRTRWLC